MDGQRIHDSLDAFLHGDHVTNVYVAREGSPPPPLAYITTFPRLTVVLAGAHPMLLTGQGQPTRIRPTVGEVVFVDSHCWNKPEWTDPGRVLAILFGQQQIGISLISHDGQASEPRAEEMAHIRRHADGVESHLLRALSSQRVIAPCARLDTLIVEALLYALRTDLVEVPVETVSKSRQTFDAICLHIQENSHRQITRESVARACQVSASHVSRLFQTEGSMRFSDYLNLVRINRSKILLRSRQATIKEIAAECGYSDTAYFCRVFQRFVRMTPTSYRAT